MDHNYNLNQNLNNSGTFNAIPAQEIHPGSSVWTGSFPNMQQLAQMNSQMGNLNITDTGTTYLDTYMAGQRGGLGAQQNGMTGPYYVASAQATTPTLPVTPNLPATTPGLPNNVPLTNQGLLNQSALNASNLNFMFSPNGQIPMKYNSTGEVMPLSPDEFALYLQLQKNMSTSNLTPGNNVSIPSVNEYQRLPQGAEPVPVTLPNTGPVSPGTGPISPASYTSGSDLHSPVTPRTPNSARDASGRRMHHMPISETSSNASSTSVPGSPTSIGGISSYSLPESTLPPSLQESENTEGERSSGSVPIRSQSLKYTVRYPQDKCFKCMKKVYPMEKIGPVKEAMYHKGCFVCNVCGTRLNMKNYFLNQDDNFDSHLYCKTHQPTKKCKGADSSSVLIKGAMSVPKLSIVNEQIRGDNSYHLDQNAVEIKHALNVPAQDIQASNKLREKAWRKGDRKSESVPPEDVVRYQDPVPEYDSETYEKDKVENNPDYDTR